MDNLLLLLELEQAGRTLLAEVLRLVAEVLRLVAVERMLAEQAARTVVEQVQAHTLVAVECMLAAVEQTLVVAVHRLVVEHYSAEPLPLW